MVKKKRLLVMMLLVMGAVGGAYFLMQTEEAKIKRQFRRLSEIGYKASGENPLAIAARVSKLKEIFSQTCQVDMPDRGMSRIFDLQEITSSAMNVISRYDTLTSDIYDMHIEISGATAHVVLTVKLTGRILSGETVEDIHEVACQLTQNQGNWLISKVELVDVLER